MTFSQYSVFLEIVSCKILTIDQREEESVRTLNPAWAGYK